MAEVDLKRLASEVSIQHGIRVDPDDPMMAVVTLNRLMLESVVADVIENLQSASRELQESANRVQFRIGARLAGDIRECAAALREELRPSVPAAGEFLKGPRGEPGARNRQPWSRDLIVGTLLFLTGVGVGLALRAF
jgi:hypothetical protein